MNTPDFHAEGGGDSEFMEGGMRTGTDAMMQPSPNVPGRRGPRRISIQRLDLRSSFGGPGSRCRIFNKAGIAFVDVNASWLFPTANE